MLDLHSHILPGLDDGVATIDEALELARRAAADGVTAIAATPHVRSDYPTTAAQMEHGVEMVRAACASAGISIEILHGAEVDLLRLWEIPRDELTRMTLAQSGRYLLLEFPYRGWPRSLSQALAHLRAQRITAVLGHPERNADVQDQPALLRAPVEAGALVQVTAASIDGRLGRSVQQTARRLLELGLVHVLASDAHAPSVREAGLAAAVEALGDEALARRLTQDNPAAVVAGERV